MIIDVHAHMLPASLQPILQRNELSLLQIPAMIPADCAYDDSDAHVTQRLRLMDEADVDIQILSPPPIPLLASKEETIAAARLVNDSHAALVLRYPDRFRAFAWLPLPYVEEALEELRRALDHLGLTGVNLPCSAPTGRSAAEDEFEPLYAEMNVRRAALFFHPYINGICSSLVNDYRLAGVVGPAFEDTLIAIHLIIKAIPSRFPNIKFIIPHLGGMLPIYLSRLDNQLPRAHPHLAEKPSVSLRRFWYDTVGHSSPLALRCACEAFGADRLVTGSDYPALVYFEDYGRSFRYIREAGLSPQQVELILHNNAKRLLGL